MEIEDVVAMGVPGNPVEETLVFFEKAKPEPTSKDNHTQIGVHFEEVAEMVDCITALDEETEALLQDAKDALEALGNHLKQHDNVVEILLDNRVDYLDALCDQMVTAIGCAYHEDMDVVGGFNEVNESNLSKFDEHGEPIFNENRKIMKGPNYRKADLAQFV